MADVEMKDESSSAKRPKVTTEGKNYSLSAIIKAHKSDVKTLTLTNSGSIISGSRDDTISFWAKKGGQFNETLKLQQPKGLAVNSLAYVDTSNGWRLFAGRKDGSIAVYGSGSSEPLSVYTEHTANVCCLFADEKNGVVLSGSWDTHVIVWPVAQLSASDFQAFKLVGHSLSVWGLATFPDRPKYYLTASADKTVKLWHNDENLTTYKGHSDVVRALVVIDSTNFLSAGNDGNVIWWNVESTTPLGKFKTKASHDFIYNMTSTDANVLSCGEDGCVEFWSIDHSTEGSHKVSSQYILNTPSASTWDVKVLQNGDVAVAASDGNIYVYTTVENRIAPNELRESYDAAVVAKITAAMARQEESKDVVIKVSLDDGPPTLDLKYTKGTDPAVAAENFIASNNLPISYLSEIIDYICANIPEARAYKKNGSIQPGQRVQVNGNSYDHVLEVSLEDGKKLQLPFNHGDDPDYAAQLFVEKHNLPVKFLGQLSQLIRSELRGGGQSNSDFYDPLTGSGRYVPGGSNPALSAAYSDPLTGGGRYVPGQASGGGSSGFSGDPFTGSGGYRTSDGHSGAAPLSSLPQDKKKPRGALVPIPSLFLFTAAGASQKAIAKLHEVNNKQEAYKLNDEQITSLEKLLTMSPETSEPSTSVITALETALQWQGDDMVPALDFLRIGLLFGNVNRALCSGNSGNEFLMKLIAILVSEPSDPLKVFVCRSIANAFAHPQGASLLTDHEISTIIPLVVKQIFGKPIVQIAATSALANFAHYLHKKSQSSMELGPREDVLRALIQGVENVPSFGGLDDGALIKLLQTIVTLMWGDTNVIKLAKNRNMVSIAAKLKDAVVAEDGKHIARDIVEMTYAV